MSRYKYMWIPIWTLSKEIMNKYDLHTLVRNIYVLCEIRCSMYGLPQTGILAYKQLVKILTPFGYTPAHHTPGLWQHKTRPIYFFLCLDDFGIKYVFPEHAEHLLAALHIQYEVTTDWTGNKYLAITLISDYINCTCDLSIPEYIAATLHWLKHPLPNRPEHSPHHHTEIQYGAPIQFTPMDDTSPCFGRDRITRVQQIVGTLKHYGRAVDNTMLVSLSYLATAQKKTPTKLPWTSPNCSTMHPQIPMRPYVMSPLIWSCIFTATPPTDQNQHCAAEWWPLHTHLLRHWSHQAYHFHAQS